MLTIDVWFDLVCPFCYIGHERLKRALSQSDISCAVNLHAFQLSPEAPQQTALDLNVLLQQRYKMSSAQAEDANAQVAKTGAALGLNFSFAAARWANSYDAHRLIKLAATQGLAAEMAERLYRAFFSEGALIGQRQTLTELALEVGLTPDSVALAFERDDSFRDEIERDRADAERLGLRSVPFYRIQGQTISSEQISAGLLSSLGTETVTSLS